MERRVEFNAAWDKRDPDPKKNYGVHGVEIRWYVIGPRGAIQFVVYTHWMLPKVEEEYAAMDPPIARSLTRPMPADLGYHSPVLMYDGHSRMEQCQLLKQGYCYYDGSSLNAVKVFDILLEKGGEAVWEFLENYYVSRFGNPDLDAEFEDGVRLPEEG